MSQTSTPNDLVIASAVGTFRFQRDLAERAIRQLTDEQLHQSLDPETNAVAVVMKHMAGNMRSRWTDFLTTDGEKPWRERDDEFVDDGASRTALLEMWEGGWNCVYAALEPLTDQDLGRIVHIRGEPQTAILAIHRQINHYGYHVGQIVQTARILAQDQWTTLSIPRGESDAFNRRHWHGTPSE